VPASTHCPRERFARIWTKQGSSSRWERRQVIEAAVDSVCPTRATDKPLLEVNTEVNYRIPIYSTDIAQRRHEHGDTQSHERIAERFALSQEADAQP